MRLVARHLKALRRSQRTLRAYIPDLVSPSFFASSDLVGSTMTTTPSQLTVRSLEPQIVHLSPSVKALHERHALSLGNFSPPYFSSLSSSIFPRPGCLQERAILIIGSPLLGAVGSGLLTAVILALILSPGLKVTFVFLP